MKITFPRFPSPLPQALLAALRRCAALWLAVAALAATARETLRLDTGWSFNLGDAPGAQAPGFDAAAWPTVSLPHDWSIALPIDHAAPAVGHGGFFANGTGWYRRVIAAPADWAGRRVEIEFEGVYGVTEVWLNGESLGRHVYGYTPFRVDLTARLKPGADNVLAVRVDNSAQPSARWYTGSGLYRPVWLQVTDPVHVVADSVTVTTTALEAARATVLFRAKVRNESSAPDKVAIETVLLDAEGRTVASFRKETTIAAGGVFAAESELTISRPEAWAPDSPSLYRAVTSVLQGRTPLDKTVTVFGVRTVRVSAERGFELNGHPVKLLGGNLHHDNGLLGAAAFDRAEERKVELLRAAGFNAVRTSHNPPSPAFLAACDRFGLLVMDEIFDGWEKSKTAQDYGRHFKEEWTGDVDAWVRRDRNHPSVVLWSTGNEMFERGNANGQRIAGELAGRIRALDPTRPVTAGVNGMGKGGEWTQLDPLFAAFDVAGYNYELAHHAADHARLPGRVILATESYQSEAFANWTVMRAAPYVIGDFVWSALDYLGEAGIGRVFRPDEPARKHWEADMFPWHAAYCGDIDLTGWRKPASHYRNIIWDRGEKLYAAVLQPVPGGGSWNVTPWSVPPALPGWTWAGHEGEPLTVEVYSRHDAVSLTLNGRVLGEKPTTAAEEFKAVFTVPYQAGELKVGGLRAGREIETVILQTAGEPAKLRLTADRTRLRAGGQDLAFVTVEAIDARGAWQPAATLPVTFTVEGAGSLAAAGTGDPTAMTPYTSATQSLYQGRALAVVRTGAAAGKIILTAKVPGFAPAKLILNSSTP